MWGSCPIARERCLVEVEQEWGCAAGFVPEGGEGFFLLVGFFNGRWKSLLM